MKSNKGSALVTVILTFTVLSILAVTLITVITARMHLTVSYADSTGALYAAQAGLEKMKLAIKDRISDVKANIHNDIQNYLTANPGATNEQLRAKVKESTEYWLYSQYLEALGHEQLNLDNMLTKGTAAYAVLPFTKTSDKPSNSYYDKVNDRIIIKSKGNYGAATKIVSLTITLSTEQEDFTGGSGMIEIPSTPLVVSDGASSSDMSVKCRSFNVYGPFSIPNGMANFANDMPINFYGDLTVGKSLTLSNSNLVITVYGNMVVNGDLTIANNSNSITLNIMNGDLLVKGDIIIDGYKGTINVANGNIKCNGSGASGGIKMNQNSGYVYVKRDLYTRNDTTFKLDNNNVQVVGGQIFKSNYQVVYNPPLYAFGDISAFQKPGVIQNIGAINYNTNLLGGYGSLNGNTLTIGSPTAPKVFYSNGDIHISLAWPVSEIEIYGIIYATGKIVLDGDWQFPNNVKIHGMLIAREKMDIDSWNMNVLLDNSINSTIFSNIETRYPGVITYVSTGGKPTTITIGVPNGFISTKWDE